MKREVRTPLSLSVLNLLNERAMHPYEMQQLMRERGHDFVIKLKGGSLYNTIERLIAAGLIEAGETSREGRRPERTVYALTAAGRHELIQWMRELLARPIHEYPWFGAVLAFLAALPPDDVRNLLEFRRLALEAEVAAGESMIRSVANLGLPRLFGIESEYALAMRRAEMVWVNGLIEEIRSGTLVWPAEVMAWHAARATGEEQ
jgi:DNA-binding PadR family transcriptional regulator